MNRPNQVMAALFAIGAAIAAGGCSTTPAGEHAAAAGDAYSLDVLVLGGDEAASDEDGPPPARYVILPDGTLYAQSPAEVGTMRLPPRVRRLNAAEHERIGQLASAAIGDANVNEAPIALESLHPPREGQLIAVIHTRGGERRLRRMTRDAGPADPDVTVLVEALESIAWAGERPAPEVVPGPIRYDLGPDPYSRYRRGE